MRHAPRHIWPRARAEAARHSKTWRVQARPPERESRRQCSSANGSRHWSALRTMSKARLRSQRQGKRAGALTMTALSTRTISGLRGREIDLLGDAVRRVTHRDRAARGVGRGDRRRDHEPRSRPASGDLRCVRRFSAADSNDHRRRLRADERLDARDLVRTALAAEALHLVGKATRDKQFSQRVAH